MVEELEDKYERFFRYFNIDLKAEIAAGGSEGGLTNYYTKGESDAITNALDARIDLLEASGPGEVDLSNYYTKSQVDSAVNTRQASDADLTAIAGLTPVNNDVLQRIGGVWTNQAPANLKSTLSLNKNDVGLGNVNNTDDLSKPISTATQSALDALDTRVDTLEGATGPDLSNYYTKTETDTFFSGKQNADSDLSAFAALTPTDNDVLQRKAGSWVNRTPSQFKSDLSLTSTDVGLGNVNNTSDAAKPISTATQTALDGKQPLDSDLTTIAGLTVVNDSVLQGKAGAWSVRTPAQLKTDLALVKSDVGLGNVDNTSDATKNSAVATLTNKDLTSGTNTFPTFNQSTTGNAATATALQTARTINGVSFNGTANITVADSTKVPTTRTVAGKALSSDVTLVKGDVGLGNVDNTSDANKPVSTATQTALDAKAPLANTPRYLLFNITWPARPADSRMTFFIGGDAATNVPADAVAGDVWIPNT